MKTRMVIIFTTTFFIFHIENKEIFFQKSVVFFSSMQVEHCSTKFTQGVKNINFEDLTS